VYSGIKFDFPPLPGKFPRTIKKSIRILRLAWYRDHADVVSRFIIHGAERPAARSHPILPYDVFFI
jgi:hypothetical protein